MHIWNSNASQGAACSELSVSFNFHDTPTLVNRGANISMTANTLVAPGSAWPPRARAVMAEAGAVTSPWRGSAAWRSLRLHEAGEASSRHEAEAAAAPPLHPALQPALQPALHAGGGAPRAAPPSGQRPPVMPPVMPPVEARHPSPAAAPVRAAGTPAADGGDEAWCRRATREQKVTPGSSWGSLAKAGEEEWMRRRCDRFFCQPHAMESRGVYRCVPVGVPVEQ